MKKIYLRIVVTILIFIGSFSVSFANESDTENYNETKKTKYYFVNMHNVFYIFAC